MIDKHSYELNHNFKRSINTVSLFSSIKTIYLDALIVEYSIFNKLGIFQPVSNYVQADWQQ